MYIYRFIGRKACLSTTFLEENEKSCFRDFTLAFLLQCRQVKIKQNIIQYMGFLDGGEVSSLSFFKYVVMMKNLLREWSRLLNLKYIYQTLFRSVVKKRNR